MNLKFYWNLLLGRTKAKVTPRNILAVIQAYYRKGRQLAGFDLPKHIYEQIIWRRTQVIALSPQCWTEGACTVCGCEILGKTMEDRGCEGPCYPEMMDKDTWKKFKTDNNIKLFD